MKYAAENERILKEIKKYKQSGKMSEQLGKYIMRLCKSVYIKKNFKQLVYKDEMIADAGLACVQQLKTANSVGNVYGFVTKICETEFEKRKKIENTQIYLKIAKGKGK